MEAIALDAKPMTEDNCNWGLNNIGGLGSSNLLGYSIKVYCQILDFQNRSCQKL